MDTKPERVVTYDMVLTLKKHITFFLSQNCTFNFTQGHYKITFISKRKELPILKFLQY